MTRRLKPRKEGRSGKPPLKISTGQIMLDSQDGKNNPGRKNSIYK
jgi:hypothetical protein